MKNLSAKWEICKLVDFSVQVKRLVEMGFPESRARSALETVGGDENLALENLCSG